MKTKINKIAWCAFALVLSADALRAARGPQGPLRQKENVVTTPIYTRRHQLVDGSKSEALRRGARVENPTHTLDLNAKVHVEPPAVRAIPQFGDVSPRWKLEEDPSLREDPVAIADFWGDCSTRQQFPGEELPPGEKVSDYLEIDDDSVDFVALPMGEFDGTVQQDDAKSMDGDREADKESDATTQQGSVDGSGYASLETSEGEEPPRVGNSRGQPEPELHVEENSHITFFLLSIGVETI